MVQAVIGWVVTQLFSRLTTRVKQWLTGAPGVAIAAVIACVALAIGFAWLRHDIASTAVTVRDALWHQKTAEEESRQRREQAQRDRAAAEAAATERKAVEEQRDAHAARVRALEDLLRERQAKTGEDPIAIPREVARTMRKKRHD